MNTLSSPAAAVERFCAERGDASTWSSVDWEVHQNLVEIALAHGPIGGVREKAGRRAAAVAIAAYVLALYAVTELVAAIRGPQLTRLGYHLAHVATGPGRRADDRLRYGSDLKIRQQIIRVALRAGQAVDRLTARIARG
ncbi:hypothetical protein [Streptomyces sp. NPDC088135]|uniref:hypothetical protein n=1 Tax=unclassified Streptomyces TaxID=2593676 RepID=UPI0034136710